MTRDQKDQIDDWYMKHWGVQKSLGNITLDSLTKLGYNVVVELKMPNEGHVNHQANTLSSISS